MEGHGGSLTGIATVALAALACGMLARALKQPSVMGYIIAGALLGPSALGIAKDRENIQLLAEFGVLMLLYLIGMELSLRAIREVWKVALVATLCQIVAGLLVMLFLGFLANWEPALIVLLGCVVALSSTAVAIKMMEEIGELRTRVGQITIGILVAQDLAVVPMMLIVGSFGGEGGIGLDALLKVAMSVGFLALLIIYLLRRERLRLPFIHKLGDKGDLIPLAGLGLCFGAAALSGLLGLSAAYGAFLAGLIIGNSTSRRVMIQHTEPIQAVLLMMFFLSIGLLIDFNYIWENIWIVLFIVTFVAVFKTALNVVVLRLLGQPWSHALLSSALLAQLGEFSFILAAVGLSAGVILDADHRLIVAVTVISLMASPFWLIFSRRIHQAMALDITSWKEILRVVFLREFRALFRGRARAEHAMVEMADSTTRWISEVVPRKKDRSDDHFPK